MYRLNVCLLSGIFEKSFGLTNFSEDYYALLNSFRALESAVNDLPYTLSPRTFEEYLEYKDWQKDYKLFCKLSHFFDDFNAFINSTLKCYIPIDRRFQDFIRRVESMKIPQQTQDTIAGFLKMELQKFIKSDEWLVLPQGDLNILQGKSKPKNTELDGYIPTAEDCDKIIQAHFRQLALKQITRTWEKFPELRLGQLISNSMPEGTDIFYVPDDKLIQLLKDFEANHERPS